MPRYMPRTVTIDALPRYEWGFACDGERSTCESREAWLFVRLGFVQVNMYWDGWSDLPCWLRKEGDSHAGN